MFTWLARRGIAGRLILLNWDTIPREFASGFFFFIFWCCDTCTWRDGSFAYILRRQKHSPVVSLLSCIQILSFPNDPDADVSFTRVDEHNTVLSRLPRDLLKAKPSIFFSATGKCILIVSMTEASLELQFQSWWNRLKWSGIVRTSVCNDFRVKGRWCGNLADTFLVHYEKSWRRKVHIICILGNRCASWGYISE